MLKNSKMAVRTLEQLVITGVHTLLAKRTIPIAGAELKSAVLEAQLRDHLATLDAIDEAKANHQALIAKERAQRRALKPVLAGIRNFALGVYGESSAEFRSFGFQPRAVAVKSAETKAGAVAKMRATRKARHTQGSRQKMAIVGTIEVAPASADTTSHPVVTNGATVTGASAH